MIIEMKRILIAISVAAGLASFTSCSEMMDLSPTDRVSDIIIWETTENAEYNINYLYSYLIDIVNGQTKLGLSESLTDMFKYTAYQMNSEALAPSQFAYGGKNLDASYVDTWMGTWGTLYTAIRKVNQAIAGLHKYGKMSDADKLRLEGELRFLRADLYFELAKRYGEVIIYDENLSAIKQHKALSSEEDVWDFIQSDLEYAARELPVKAEASGRLDKGMAYALTTRAMLYAKRWDAVIAAADAVKELGYSLETNYSDSYQKAINGGNKEAILQYTFSYADGLTHSMDARFSPGGDFVKIGKSGNGGVGVPTQELVESYELATGGLPDWSVWHTAAGTTQTPPYADLEPRFHATILYNGAKWKDRNIEPYIGGLDGWAVWKTESTPGGKTVSGYYLRKLVDEGNVELRNSDTPITIIRYAEVLLNKAEACYNAGDVEGANDAIEMIRARVGLPYTDKAGSALFQAIRQERRVELAMEGFWYWDLRRWGVAHKQYPEGLTGYQQHGLKIEKQDDGTFKYTYVSIDESDRECPERLTDRFPIPISEYTNNDLVDQFEEWR